MASVTKPSAGLLLYRSGEHGLEVFLVHPGGPFWFKKDIAACSIPKGEFEEGEDSLHVNALLICNLIETGNIPATIPRQHLFEALKRPKKPQRVG